MNPENTHMQHTLLFTGCVIHNKRNKDNRMNVDSCLTRVKLFPFYLLCGFGRQPHHHRTIKQSCSPRCQQTWQSSTSCLQASPSACLQGEAAPAPLSLFPSNVCRNEFQGTSELFPQKPVGLRWLLRCKPLYSASLHAHRSGEGESFHR